MILEDDESPPLTLLPERVGLPRGRAALPESEVAASQRGRILQAVTEEVAARGYAATTVQHVSSRARVSRTAFYEHFEDKQDAFTQAHREASQQLLDLVRHQVAANADAPWRQRLQIGVEAYLVGFERAPAYAVSFAVELHAAGPRVLEQRDHFIEQHALHLRRLAGGARAEDPRVRRPSRLVAIGVVGAADELAIRQIRAARRGEPLNLDRLTRPIVTIYEAVLVR